MTGNDKTSNGEQASTNASASEEKKKVIRVAVGSKNPVKVNAAKRALEKVLASSPSAVEVALEVQGFDVPSEVPDQPFGDVRRECNVRCCDRDSVQCES